MSLRHKLKSLLLYDFQVIQAGYKTSVIGYTGLHDFLKLTADFYLKGCLFPMALILNSIKVLFLVTGPLPGTAFMNYLKCVIHK